MIEIVIDWFWTGFILKLREKYATWVWMSATIAPVLFLALLGATLYIWAQ